jgi:hypothetical protein
VSEGSKVGHVWLYLLVYLLWFGAIALTGLDFLLLRSVISQWYIVLDLPANAHKAIDRFYIFFAGAFWIFLIFFTEGYLRDGVIKADLKSRFKIVYGTTAAFALIMAFLLFTVTAYVYLMAQLN